MPRPTIGFCDKEMIEIGAPYRAAERIRRTFLNEEQRVAHQPSAKPDTNRCAASVEQMRQMVGEFVIGSLIMKHVGLGRHVMAVQRTKQRHHVGNIVFGENLHKKRPPD